MENKFSQIQLPMELKEFYKQLKSLQDSFMGKGILKINKSKISQEEYMSGVPALSILGLKVNFRLFIKCLKEMKEFTQKERPFLEEGLKPMVNILKSRKDQLWPVVESFLWQNYDDIEKFCVDKGINDKIFSLVLVNTLRSLLKEVAVSLEDKVDLEEWKENYCPVCGGHPVVASIEPPDSQRFLYCSLCSTKWQFKRLACVNCKNENHDSLGYLRIEQLEGYQIEFCKKCNSYIKTILGESKFINQDDLQTLDLETIFLDIIAEDKGMVKANKSREDNLRLN